LRRLPVTVHNTPKDCGTLNIMVGTLVVDLQLES
jgi:hypothetical protein